MPQDSLHFLASLYDPPLRSFSSLAGHPFQRAQAAAWGQALQEWLSAYPNPKTRRHYRQAVSSLLSFSRKMPWRVRPADVTGWREAGLSEKAGSTLNTALRRVAGFYRFACRQTWTGPSGEPLPLCPADPCRDLVPPASPWLPRLAPLTAAELSCLLAAFDRQSRLGQRDLALFTLILETGLRLKEALALRLVDLAPPQSPPGLLPPSPAPLIPRGRDAAWQAVHAYLQDSGRLAAIQPGDYLFPPLKNGASALPGPGPHAWDPDDWEPRPLQADTARLALKAYAASAGLDPALVTPEALRYTAAARLLAAGASLPDLAAFLRLKSLGQVRRLARSLQDAARRSPGVQTPPPPPASFHRRPPGAPPGNRNRLIHGARSSRYRMSRLGIANNSVKGVDPADIPAAIAELQNQIGELLELPDGTLNATIKKLDKLGYTIYTVGRLKARLIRYLRGQDLDG